VNTMRFNSPMLRKQRKLRQMLTEKQEMLFSPPPRRLRNVSVTLIKCKVCGHGRDKHKRCRHCVVDRIIATWNLVKQIESNKKELTKSQYGLSRDLATVLRTHNNLYKTLSDQERLLLKDREGELKP